MQALIAYSIVFAALIYAAWLFMPQKVRSRLVALVTNTVPASQRARFERLQSPALSAGCSTCKGCATDAKSTTARKTIPMRRR